MTTTSTSTPAATPASQLTPQARILAIVGASSGNLVEWFDFYIYSFCALYFSSSFFPSGNPTTQLPGPGQVRPAEIVRHRCGPRRAAVGQKVHMHLN